MKEKKQVFTVGHSNHTIDYFYELLKFYGINCLIDVRSIPASKFSPQFNQNYLSIFLKKRGIIYMHFKDEFGARQEDTDVLNESGQVNFELFRKTAEFQRGIQRIKLGLSKGYKIALMCAEANPLECHRFSMIAHYLNETGFDIQHIMKNKDLKAHKELEEELLKKYAKKLPEPSLFEPNISQETKLKVAYQLHNKQIGWTVESNLVE